MPTPLSAVAVDLLTTARRAVLATTRANGSPRLLPLAFAADLSAEPPVVYSALDEKPKRVTDVRDLARVRDILARPRVELLVDNWSEDWAELAWLRLDGAARLLEPDRAADAAEHARAVEMLRARYPQYARQQLEDRPIIRIAIERTTGWQATR